ncbi:MAG TPA: alpha/beta hydrolase [Opitutaceae bacterium]
MCFPLIVLLAGAQLPANLLSAADAALVDSSWTISAEDMAFVQDVRARYRAMIPTAGEPDPVSEVRNLSIPATKPERAIAARLYIPKDHQPGEALPLILFFHGGGYVSGDFDTHDVIVRALANRTSSLVLSIDWRLAPEHPFPAGVEDAYASLAWAAAHSAELGADANRIVAAGDSAGGNLAAALALATRDRKSPRMAALVLFYPHTGGPLNSPSWTQYGTSRFPNVEYSKRLFAFYSPQDGGRMLNPLASPFLADLHGLPPTLVITAEFDPLKDDGRAFAEKLRAAGGIAQHTEYPGATHGFVQFFKDKSHQPQGEQALGETSTFLRRALRSTDNYIVPPTLDH